MTSWNRERQNALKEEWRQRVRHTREVIADHFEPTDLTAPDDETFLAFVAQKQVENPNWLLALPYVRGGLQVLSRYERLTGLNNGV